MCHVSSVSIRAFIHCASGPSDQGKSNSKISVASGQHALLHHRYPHRILHLECYYPLGGHPSSATVHNAASSPFSCAAPSVGIKPPCPIVSRNRRSRTMPSLPESQRHVTWRCIRWGITKQAIDPSQIVLILILTMRAEVGHYLSEVHTGLSVVTVGQVEGPRRSGMKWTLVMYQTFLFCCPRGRACELHRNRPRMNLPMVQHHQLTSDNASMNFEILQILLLGECGWHRGDEDVTNTPVSHQSVL